MDPQPATYQPLVIYSGRRFGWWIEGRKSNGRRYMFYVVADEGVGVLRRPDVGCAAPTADPR
jgi:hypothetical protein